MTRFLSEALRASEPAFRRGLQKLEAANGHPSNDIRLSASVTRATKDKLRQLGVDPDDTTAEELYHALQARITADDHRLVKALRTRAATQVSAEANINDGLLLALKEVAGSAGCFALKTSKLKTLIKKVPPKKAMKQLGYRSLDSLLKHEPPACILAAAWLLEGERWQKQLLDQYKKLTAGDFESRAITIIQPNGKRWQQLSQEAVNDKKHNLLSFKELGTLILLPFPVDVPAGAVTVSLALALHELNEIRAGSTFLKLSQVQTDFGSVVQTIAADEPRLTAQMLDRPVPWQLVQRFYARLSHLLEGGVFEPHIQAEDMSWQSVEQALSEIEPSFEFWHDSGHLGLLHNHQPVSLNLLDVALSYCNQLPFEQRLVHYFQRALGHELLLHYLQPSAIEQAINAQLQPALAAELSVL